MLLANIFLLISIAVSIILTLLIFFSNPKRLNNRSLTFFTASLFLWLLANLLTNIATSHDLSIAAVRSTLVGGALLPYSFLIFCYSYVENTFSVKTRNKLLKFGILPLILLIFTPTALNVISVGPHGVNTEPGIAYYLLIVELLLYFFIGLRKLYIASKSHSTTGEQKSQIRYVFIGLVLTAIPAITASVILPIFHNSVAAFYGPDFVIILAVFMSIAIIRHGLLDIRLVAARSVGYILTLVSVTVIFVTPTVIFTTSVLHKSLSTSTAIFIGVVTCIVAIIFQSLRTVFDKVTNRVFFRDYYNFQDVLDELGNLLVGSIDLENIEKKSSDILSSAMKTSFIRFLLITNEHADQHELIEELLSTKSNMVVTDELNADQHSTLYKKLSDSNISLVVRLRTTKEDLGFIIAGYKQSGTIYTQTDKRLLTIAADEIAVSLQNALRFEEIQKFNITLSEKIEVATKQLRAANERLKLLDATKDDFISMASHQLRTPLTSIKGYVSMVLEGDAGKINKTQDKFLTQAFNSSRRMANLVSDLLNVSRIDSGKFFINAVPINLADLIEEIIGELTEMAKSRSIDLVYKKPDNFPVLMLDEDKSAQVVTNFIDNAIHYGKENGKIVVELADEGTAVSMKVIDDGIGVPKSVQKQLFTKFFRADNAKTARPDGTGIGLYLAHKVIDSQGGTVIFESQENKGSTFGFRFPKDKLLANATNTKKT